jgi:hypothetical protein
MLDETLHILRKSDAYAAVAERIGRQGSVDEIAKRFSEESNELYWKKRDISGAILIGQCGIIYCLERAEGCDGEVAERLRGAAKGMAFNVASFAWLGWDEKGITITAAHLDAGRMAAKLNLEMAVQLRRGAKPMMNAHWMIGAYHLADGQTDQAVAAFEEAGNFAEQAEDAAAVGMCRGYVALARGDDGKFAEALTTLRRIGSEDAGFYADQLETAKRVFVGK